MQTDAVQTVSVEVEAILIVSEKGSNNETTVMSESDSIDIEAMKLMQKIKSSTTRNSVAKIIDFNDIGGDDQSSKGGLTDKQRIEYEYLKKRDPMKEFF